MVGHRIIVTASTPKKRAPVGTEETHFFSRETSRRPQFLATACRRHIHNVNLKQTYISVATQRGQNDSTNTHTGRNTIAKAVFTPSV